MILQTHIIDVAKLDKHEIEYLFDQCVDLVALLSEFHNVEECKSHLESLIDKCSIPFNEGLMQ